MSRVTAYLCDCCGIIVEEDACVGVSQQADMFDAFASYPTVHRPEKAFVHQCLKCYEVYVTSPAMREVNRKVAEEAYKHKLRELHYNLRATCVRNFASKKALKK